MACRFCARRRRASDLQVFTRSANGICSPTQSFAERKTLRQATMAFYGLFACHPLTVCPTWIQLLNSSEVIRQAETDPLVDGTGCEVVPCLKVLQTPCVLHWWIFLQVPSAEVLPRESPKDVRSLGPVQLGVGSQIAHLIIWPRQPIYIYIYI